jgi:type II secretory pathway component PulJ
MKIRLHRRNNRNTERGFAVLVVIVLLAIMAALAVGNNVTIATLQRELRLVERRQQQRVETLSATNAPVPIRVATSSGPAGVTAPASNRAP